MLAPRLSCTARSGVARSAGLSAAAPDAPAAGSAGPGSDVLIGLASKPHAWPPSSPRQRGRAPPTEPSPAARPQCPRRPGACGPASRQAATPWQDEVAALAVAWLPEPAAGG